MRQILSQYSGEHQSIFVVFIGDVHFGNKYFNPSYLDIALNFVARHRQRCRLVLMGDLLEAATKTSVGRAVYDENYPTQKQFEKAVETFLPFAENIDLVLEGNHEERIIKDTSFEITQEMCHRWGRIDAYGKFSAVVNFNLSGGLTYSLYAWHGATSSTKESGAINGLLGMRERCVAHIYAMGHTHKLLTVTKKIVVPNPSQERVQEVEQLFINTGSALDYGGYGEQKGFSLVKAGFGAVQIFADKRKVIFHKIEDLV